MNLHDEFIKKAKKEIDKLTADIEKKKSHITRLRSEIKKHEAEKTRDRNFCDRVITFLNENGMDSDEERNTFFSKFEDIMLEMEMEKSENTQTEETAQAEINDNINPGTSAVYQNPQYPYRPTGSIDQ